ncbi:GLPGLI family protein [Chryseobacterium arachidis]|uniref:GLPGLI family protein n=1 Tax=Chryseobacterium arachidis TaxID=1416778 RepID=A0A1M5GJU9_9FLAO|nr:GLPGLI family protein [Chryseobacterium arachidis]SHG03999.1 GLPGLI family protein [Chryseobacterium arachidis]
MKKLLFTFLMVSALAKSQTHRFIYDVIYKKDSTSTVQTKENYHLDINQDNVTYYTRDFFVADSLINNNLEFPKGQKLNTSNIVFHRKGSDQYDEFDLLEGSTILKLQSTDSQKWNLTNESKKIKDLTLQKATATFGGRTWTAWFTKEIPFQEGPYKFHGLPGLIVELYDDKENYRFELVTSSVIEKSPKNQFIEMSRQMAAPVDWEKYKKAKLAFYESPVNYIKNGRSSDQFFLNDGTKVNPANYREINERLRQNIKKYNNPINLEKAVIYP